MSTKGGYDLEHISIFIVMILSEYFLRNFENSDEQLSEIDFCESLNIELNDKERFDFSQEGKNYIIGECKKYINVEKPSVKILLPYLNNISPEFLQEILCILSNEIVEDLSNKSVSDFLLDFKKYLESRTTIHHLDISENSSLEYIEIDDDFSFEDEPIPFSETHPKLAKTGKVLKNAAIWLGGSLLNLTDEQIEKLQNEGLSEILYDAPSILEERAMQMQDSQERKHSAKYEKFLNAWAKYGIDYEYFKTLSNNRQKAEYLKSKGINSQSEYNALKEKVKEEYKEM